MTRGDLKRHVRLEFGFDSTASSDEDLLMNDWANEAVRMVLLDTRCRVEVGDISISANVEDFRQDVNVLAILDATISASTVKPAIVTPEHIYDLRRASGIATSPDVTRLAYQGDLLLIWPKPTSTITIRTLYIAKPTEMTSDANDINTTTYGGLPVYANHAVKAYMRWEAATYDQVKAPLTPEDYFQQYKRECLKIRQHLRRMGGRTPVGISTGYPADMRFPRRNDVYPSE